MGSNRGILQRWAVLYLLFAGGYGVSYLIASAHADSFYPACLKPDGDWLHGATRKECIGRDVRGRWYTNRTLKKVQRVM